MSNKYLRSVSIIGVGDIRQGTSNLDPVAQAKSYAFGAEQGSHTPELEDLSMFEMFAYSAQEAMKDANINPQQIDQLVYSNVANISSAGMTLGCHPTLLDWAGMHGKASMHIETACASSFVSFQSAVNDIASGRYDIVMVASTEFSQQAFLPWGRADKLVPIKENGLNWSVAPAVYGPAYQKFNGGVTSMPGTFEHPKSYMDDYGLSFNQIDETLNSIVISTRHNASLNPKAFLQTTYEQIAKEAGFSSAQEYLMSEKHNPHLNPYFRALHNCPHCNGAGAVILCASDIAKQFNKKPIEVLSTGISCLTQYNYRSQQRMNREAFAQAYEMAGVRPEEIDLLMCTDMMASEQLESAESCGYLPKGEGWKYFIDGRTRCDGDKPINTHGGDLSAGHAYGSAGMPFYAELVRQMRGQCGSRQVKNLPRTTMLRGFGGGHTTVASIFRTLD